MNRMHAILIQYQGRFWNDFDLGAIHQSAYSAMPPSINTIQSPLDRKKTLNMCMYYLDFNSALFCLV
jgi:hypothetical protein